MTLDELQASVIEALAPLRQEGLFREGLDLTGYMTPDLPVCRYGYLSVTLPDLDALDTPVTLLFYTCGLDASDNREMYKAPPVDLWNSQDFTDYKAMVPWLRAQVALVRQAVLEKRAEARKARAIVRTLRDTPGVDAKSFATGQVDFARWDNLRGRALLSLNRVYLDFATRDQLEAALKVILKQVPENESLSVSTALVLVGPDGSTNGTSYSDGVWVVHTRCKHGAALVEGGLPPASYTKPSWPLISLPEFRGFVFFRGWLH